jgi:uncharacterized NAD-dependent epimerase/dehydratase family protein
MLLLTAGYSNPRTAKTAAGLLRYCPDECVGVYDPSLVGKPVEPYLGSGAGFHFVDSLDSVPEANMLVIGIAPPGGKVPAEWKPVLLQAIDRGMDLLSGLHDFLCEDPDLVQAAKAKGTRLIDIRKNDFRDIARRRGLRDDCYRLHTVGQDCSLGKMVVSLEVARGLASGARRTVCRYRTDGHHGGWVWSAPGQYRG